ncbi:hypothetical protein BPOR_1165g00010 [Botrytis porri]|uniref:Uncharacterized protein n=1 Tax=Botrytis porri TaxID=87229 RepID=A0A4Z1K7G1_9HELO|nr:hypothetical protein BPOR_1165g00010 [Botrytis porri]
MFWGHKVDGSNREPNFADHSTKHSTSRIRKIHSQAPSLERMEALAALNIAGNIMKFVDFSSKIISEARAIEKNGESSSIADLQRFTLSSTKHARIIRSRLQASSYTRPLSEENQHLVDLAADCERAGHEFAVCLSTFSTSRTARNFLHNLKDSIRIRWRHEAIVAFVEKLESFRGALTLAAILAFQSNVDDRNENIIPYEGTAEVKRQE